MALFYVFGWKLVGQKDLTIEGCCCGCGSAFHRCNADIDAVIRLYGEADCNYEFEIECRELYTKSHLWGKEQKLTLLDYHNPFVGAHSKLSLHKI